MVGKLMKHEWRRTRGILGIMTLIAIGIGVIAWIGSMISPIVFGPAFMIGVLVASLLPFATQVYLAMHLYQTTYGRRGYFEHAIPVKGSTLLLTKYLYAAIVSVFSLALSAILIYLLHLGERNIGSSTVAGFGQAWELLGQWSPWAQPLVIVGGLLTVLSYLAHFYFSVTVGSESWINKQGVMGPVLVFVLAYVGLQLVSFLGLLFIPPAYSIERGQWEWGIPFLTLVNNSDSGSLPAMAIVLSFVASGVLLWRAVVSVNKKLELR